MHLPVASTTAESAQISRSNGTEPSSDIGYARNADHIFPMYFLYILYVASDVFDAYFWYIAQCIAAQNTLADSLTLQINIQ